LIVGLGCDGHICAVDKSLLIAINRIGYTIAHRRAVACFVFFVITNLKKRKCYYEFDQEKWEIKNYQLSMSIE
jgi:hypothetical protein